MIVLLPYNHLSALSRSVISITNALPIGGGVGLESHNAFHQNGLSAGLGHFVDCDPLGIGMLILEIAVLSIRKHWSETRIEQEQVGRKPCKNQNLNSYNLRSRNTENRTMFLIYQFTCYLLVQVCTFNYKVCDKYNEITVIDSNYQ